MDSFESAAEPVPVQGQQTHYAKSNLVKGKQIVPWTSDQVYEPVSVQWHQTHYVKSNPVKGKQIVPCTSDQI